MQCSGLEQIGCVLGEARSRPIPKSVELGVCGLHQVTRLGLKNRCGSCALQKSTERFRLPRPLGCCCRAIDPSPPSGAVRPLLPMGSASVQCPHAAARNSSVVSITLRVFSTRSECCGGAHAFFNGALCIDFACQQSAADQCASQARGLECHVQAVLRLLSSA